MPELPEVETARRVAHAALLGRVVIDAEVCEDPIVLERRTGREVRAALVGRTVVGSARYGKHFWLVLDRGPHPVFHLGMTGSIEVGAPDAPAPRFAKASLFTDDGARVSFINKRRLGRLRLRERPREEAPISALGFDPLLDMPALDVFDERLRARHAPVKAVLLDQSFAAGVGNWIADEVLYQARIAPARRASDLDEREVKALRTTLLRVISRAVDVGADDTRFPKTWLFHVRWGKVAGSRTARGEAVVFDEVGGRTTAWVPSRQR